MATTRRQFIKRGAGAVTASVLIPQFDFARRVFGQPASLGRKLVIIQFGGGNDGLNTVIPYTDSFYYQNRPNLAFQPEELKDSGGGSTIIDSRFGFHPRLKETKDLYNAGKVAVVLGVGSEIQSTSHFQGTGNIAGGKTGGAFEGGVFGRYAKQAFAGHTEFLSAAVGGSAPQILASDYVIPTIASFAQFTFQTDGRYQLDGRNNQIPVFTGANSRSFPAGSFLQAIASTGNDAFEDATTIQTETAKYNPTGYPTTGLGNALKMIAQLFVTIPTTALAHCQIGGFDNHQNQLATIQGTVSKLDGGHAGLLMQFSQALKAFYDDMAANGISRDLLVFTYSEFGRRPRQNGTLGSDHGHASCWFVIGDGVRGGIYGGQETLAPSNLDRNGNQKATTDFRSVYAEILERWLNHDSRAVLGASYPSIGFLP